MSWQPILAGDEAAHAHRIALLIADAVAGVSHDEPADDGLRLLLDAYLAQALGSERHADRALAALQALSVRARPGLAFGLFGGGLAGLGWVASHVRGLLADWLEPEDGDARGAIDEALIALVQHYPEPGPYDLMSGLAGIAVYACGRMPEPESEELLCAVVDRLAATAETADGGIRWHTAARLLPEHQRRAAPDGYYNLGVAHGLPAVAWVLARAMSAGLRRDVAGPLLDGLVSWVTTQRSATGGGSRFPGWVPKGAPMPAGAREAWCYGGLGLSVTLLAAARWAQNASWEEAARGFARLEAARPPEQSGVADMCLCHGGAGNGHLYNRLYQCTGETIFLDAARKWLRATLAAHAPGVDGGGYFFLRSSPQSKGGSAPVTRPDPSFLDGSAGVALALLAASTDLEPGWDRVLMADLPPRLSAPPE